jgi:EAL domain-containing protein (putative c-di-GMP-specific phosphodiesterase class I)
MIETDGPDGGRILVVDDEAGLRDAYTRILTAQGFRVDSCESAEGVVERLRAGHRYLVIVSDLVMGGMDGIELMRAVRALDAEVPVIIITGRPTLRSTIAAVEHHMFRYLVKPVMSAMLAETVRGAAAMHRLALLKRRALEVCENDGWVANASSLEESFESALSKLFMVYQPIVPVAGQAIGFEALVRTAETSLVSPDKLFAAAEQLGRVQELGRTIRRHVSEQIASAPDGALLFVNLHASDLGDPELYSPNGPLSRHAKRVILEVTERKSLDGVLDVKERLVELRKLGYQIAVDDLGAGYAGLSCFAALEPDIVKLDMSLIRGIDTSPAKRAIVESMIRVCQGELGIRVVCEGVETSAELETLVSVGASLLQGYLFGRPQRGFVYEPAQAPPTEARSEQRLSVAATLSPPTSKTA